MIDFSGNNPARTLISIPTLTNTTIYCNFVTGSDITTQAYLFYFGTTSLVEYCVYIKNSKLYFQTIYSVLSGDPDSWSCPVSTETKYGFGLKYNFTGTATSNVPVVYLNGTKQNMTQESTRSGTISAHGSDSLVVGGYWIYLSGFINWTQVFNSRISGLILATSQHSDIQMEKATAARTMRVSEILNLPDVILDVPMDDVYIGQNIATGYVVHPNGDNNSLWTNKTLGTYYESILENNDTDYISATGADDNERQEFNMGTITLGANETVFQVDVTLILKTADDAQLSVSLYKGSSWSTAWASSGVGSSYSTVTFAFLGTWTQAELDGMLVGLTTPTMDKADTITVCYMYATIYTDKNSCRDYSGNGYHLVGTDAVGAGESVCSYV